MTEKVKKLLEVLELALIKVDERIPHKETFYNRYGSNYPSINSEWIKETIRRLSLYLKENDFNTTPDFDTQVDMLITAWEAWHETPLSNLANSSYFHQAIQSFELLINNTYLILDRYKSTLSTHDIQRQWRESQRGLIALQSRLEQASSETDDLDEKIRLINGAVDASNRLPNDIESLKRARSLVANCLVDVRNKTKDINHLHAEMVQTQGQINETKIEIEKILDKANEALAFATSSGLAAAFNRRARELKCSSRWWVAALVISLIAAMWLGYQRFNELFVLLQQGTISTELLIINFLFSCVLVSAPLWFAWLATKRIGYLFKLSEDYAFKATASTAYEGFRREASNHGEDMEEKVLSSTLNRFDEQPLRLVDEKVVGSPWHEILLSGETKMAMKDPSFKEEFKKFVKTFDKSKDKANASVEDMKD